jgi:F0F1-type ATP synthase membrane subunit b/b'
MDMNININTLLWLAGAVLMLVTLAQWVVLRSRYLAALTQQRTRHALQLQAAGQQFEQAKHQIAQLHRDLGSARAQLARIATRQANAIKSHARPTGSAQPVRHNAGAAAHGQPVDGFADTLPAPQYPHDGALLATYPKRH